MYGLAPLFAYCLGVGPVALPVQPGEQSSGRRSPIRVGVTFAAKEAAARQLGSAVVKTLQRDRRFDLVDAGSPAQVTIVLPARVGWDRRLGWTDISYQARLTSAGGDTRVVAGHCWNWNFAVCAQQIIDTAATLAAKR